MAQVMLYQYAFPQALPQHKGVAFCGQVAYPDHVVDIPAEAVDDEFVRRMGRLVQRISAEESARRVPSAGECRFCDVLTCPEWVGADAAVGESSGV